MQRAWRTFKYKLHTHFKKVGGDEDLTKAKKSCPEECKKEDWEYLCNHWADAKYKVMNIFLIVNMFGILRLNFKNLVFLTRNKRRRTKSLGVKENGIHGMDQRVPSATILLVDLS